MIAIRHRKIWAGVLIGVILLLVFTFRYCYGQVNDPKTAFRVKEMENSYGESLDVNGIMVTVEKPSREKCFDKDFNMYVLRYKIPFEAHNISENDEFDFDETNLQIISAGRVRFGWPWNSYDDETNADTNWGALKPGETTRGVWQIDVVLDDMFPEEVYEDYDLYYLQHDGDVLFKYRFTDN